MSAKIEGGCLCGAVRYGGDAEPVVTVNCHCRDCQMASGAPCVTIVAFPQDSVTFTGKAATHTKTSDRGGKVHRSFCPECGTYVSGVSEMEPLVTINAVTLDDASWVKPQMQIYVSSKQPWTVLDPDLPAFDKLPPMEDG